MPSVAVASSSTMGGYTDLRGDANSQYSSHCKEVHRVQSQSCSRCLCGLKFEDLHHPLGSSWTKVVLCRVRHRPASDDFGRALCDRTFEDLHHPLGMSYYQGAYDHFGSWPDFGVGVAGLTRPVQDLGGLPSLCHQLDLCGCHVLQDL